MKTNVEKPVLFVTETGKEIKDKYDLVDYFNDAEDWPNDAEEAMKALGFVPSKDDFDIAYNFETMEYLITIVEGSNNKSSIELLDLPEDHEINIEEMPEILGNLPNIPNFSNKIIDDYTVIKDQEDRFYFIPNSQIVHDAPLHEAVSASNDRDAAYYAGDYSLMNIDSDAGDDMLEAGSKIFGEGFKNLEYTFDYYDSFELDNLDEVGMEDKENEILEFITNWRKENEGIALCDYYSYWNGHENKYIILSCDTPECSEPEYEVLDVNEAAPILQAFEKVTEWEDGRPGIKRACCGGYKFFDSSWEGRIGSYEAVFLDDDERMESALGEGPYTKIDTTSASNGQPEDVKEAIIGFDSYEEAEELAERYGLQVSEFYSREGWQMMSRRGKAFGELEYREEDFGDNYEFLTYEDIEIVLNKMRNQLEDCTTWNEAKEVYEKAEKVQEAMDDLEDDEVLVVEGLNIFDRIKRHTMSKGVDSQNWVIGVEPKE